MYIVKKEVEFEMALAAIQSINYVNPINTLPFLANLNLPVQNNIRLKGDTLNRTVNTGNIKTINFFSIKADTPIFTLPGFKGGDNVELDGPLWYDGNGKIAQLDSNAFAFQFSMKVPGSAGKYFKIVNGKINLTIKVQKDTDNQIKVVTRDNNAGTERVDTGSFTQNGNTITINGGGQTITLKSTGNGKANMTCSNMPGSLNLIKKG